MRIRGWHIDGFGIHRDWRVDAVSPGLTVFYGPNEAGKTTLLAFLRGVLFGYPDGRSNEPKYAPPGGGPHGGRITLEGDDLADDGGAWVIERFTGRGKLSVTLEDGTPGDADDVASRLGHADARLFRNVYAFGLSELQELDTLGEAGIQDHLFSAGITGAGRSARQASRALYETSRDLFAGARARKGDRARALTAEIGETKAELRRRREEAERYPELREAEQALAAQLDALKAEAEREQAAEQRATKLVALWNELWSPLADMREQAAKLSLGAPDELPLDARPRLVASLAAIQADQEKLGAIGTEREALALQLEPLRVDDAARAVAPRVEALHQQLALHRSRCERLAELDAQISECEARRARVAANLGDGFSKPPGAVGKPPGAVGKPPGAVEEPPGAVGKPPGAVEREPGADERLRALRSTTTLRGELREWRRRLDAGRDVLAERSAATTRPLPEDGLSTPRPQLGIPLLLLGLAVLAATGALSLERLLLLPALLLGGAAIVVYRRVVARSRDEREAREQEQALARARVVEDRRLAEQALSDLEQAFGSWKRTEGIPEPLDVDGAGEFLEDVRRARDLLEEHDRLEVERRRAEGDVAAWELGAEDVLADCPFERPPGDDLDPCASLLALRERCEADRVAREHRKPLEERGRQLRDRFVACEAALAESRGVLADLTCEAGATDAEDLQRRLNARDAARELAERISSAESDLARRIEAGGADESAALREELPLGRVAEWEEQSRDFRSRAASAQEARDEVLRQHQNAALELERLEQSTDVFDLELEKAAFEQELREVADDWRRLRLASRLIDTALERFEGKHQPGVLRAAGRLFSEVTSGGYTRIVQSEEGAGFSVVSADGMHRSPRQLSRGTAEQLYLCVRLGLVAELTRTRVPLPVVMDDVLVNFDDARAAAMARVLAHFADAHQLFFFTCSARTRDLLVEASTAVEEKTLGVPAASSS